MTPTIDWPGLAYFVVVGVLCVSWLLVPAVVEFIKEYRAWRSR